MGGRAGRFCLDRDVGVLCVASASWKWYGDPAELSSEVVMAPKVGVCDGPAAPTGTTLMDDKDLPLDLELREQPAMQADLHAR